MGSSDVYNSEVDRKKATHVSNYVTDFVAFVPILYVASVRVV